MKKIFYLIALIVAVISCKNEDISFDDFEYQTVYFPFQTPVRTIMLGDEVIGDNSIDLEHAFSIGATMGGAYENSKDRVLSIELAPNLASNITVDGGNELMILPSTHYTATLDQITIPKGSFIGKLRVDLTDAFFNDPLATSLNYVLPVRITTAQDSILQGLQTDIAKEIEEETGIPTDPRIITEWTTVPKDYVLFGVKYINPTHGVYLLRGKRTDLNDPDPETADVYYSKQFINQNEMTKLTTNTLTENFMATVGGTNKERSNAKYSMKLTFDGSNGVTVSQRNDDTVDVSGTGTYVSKDEAGAEGFNDKTHRTIYLDYTYEDNGTTYQVNDSLVFVDTDIRFEEFVVAVTE